MLHESNGKPNFQNDYCLKNQSLFCRPDMHLQNYNALVLTTVARYNIHAGYIF